MHNSHLTHLVLQLLCITAVLSFHLFPQFTCSNCFFWKQVISFFSEKAHISVLPAGFRILEAGGGNSWVTWRIISVLLLSLCCLKQGCCMSHPGAHSYCSEYTPISHSHGVLGVEESTIGSCFPQCVTGVNIFWDSNYVFCLLLSQSSPLSIFLQISVPACLGLCLGALLSADCWSMQIPSTLSLKICEYAQDVEWNGSFQMNPSIVLGELD